MFPVIGVLRLAVVAVLAGVVYAEARKGPGAERLRGTALGFVPYDLRPQSLADAPRTYWDPDEPRVFTGRPAPIGWSFNLAALTERIRRL